MRTYRTAAMLAVAAVAAVSLSACSAGDTGDGDADTIQFMFRGGPDEKAAYEEAIERYTEDTGIKVEMIVTDADQYATKLQAAVSGGKVPDVFYIEQANLQSYVHSGVLMDITELVEESDVDLDNIWPFGVDSYRFDGTLQGTPEGKLYGLPKDVGPFAFGYNKTMFEEAGLELPSPDQPYTWDEFVDITEKLTVDKDGDGALDQ
jgi:multiple sugar transport system substrate-binding protein